MDGIRGQTLTPLLGIAAIVVTFGSIGLAILLSPAFAVEVNALSNLGDAGHAAGTATTELLFNGGLILGGLCGIGFAIGLALSVEHAVSRVGAAIFGVSMASMGGVGVFPQDGPFHFEVAAGFYLLFSVALLVYGPGQILVGRVRDGVLSLSIALANLAVWILWTTTVGITAPGLAIPELLGAGLVAIWTLLQVRQEFLSVSLSGRRATA